jgi:hypothetical protein
LPFCFDFKKHASQKSLTIRILAQKLRLGFGPKTWMTTLIVLGTDACRETPSAEAR